MTALLGRRGAAPAAGRRPPGRPTPAPGPLLDFWPLAPCNFRLFGAVAVSAAPAPLPGRRRAAEALGEHLEELPSLGGAPPSLG